MSSQEAIEAGAKALAPLGLVKPHKYPMGCGCSWHYETHSYHSTCGRCGSRTNDTIEGIERRQAQIRKAARRQARTVLRAAEKVKQ